MQTKTLIPLLSAGAAVALALAPGGSNADTGTDARAIATIAQEVIAQQRTIAANQAQIEERLAGITEELRTARIFAARAGGPAKK